MTAIEMLKKTYPTAAGNLDRIAKIHRLVDSLPIDIVRAEVEAYRALLDRRSTKRDRTPLEEAIEHKQNEVIEYPKGLN